MLVRTSAIMAHVSLRLIIILVFVTASLSLTGRVLIAQVDHFKSEIESELAAYGITGVSLESVEGSWRGFHPILKIHGASLSIPGRSQALSINQLELSVKLFSTLLHGELKLLSLHSKIEKLIVVRDKSANWWLKDIPLKGQQNIEDKLDVHAFFSRLPDFVSIDIRILQILDKYNDTEYLIQRTGLHSSRAGDLLSLTLNSQLPAALGKQLNVKLIGDAESQQMYLDVDAVGLASLAQLFDIKLPGVDEARVSLKSWINMAHYQPRQIINDAEFSEVVTSGISGDQAGLQQVSDEMNQEIRFKLHQKAIYLQGDWQIDSEFDHVYRGQSRLPGFNSRLIIDQAHARPKVWVDGIDLQALQILLSDIIRNEESFSLINRIALRAKIKNFVAEFDVNDINQSTLSFDFEHLRSQRDGQIPAVNGLAGKVKVSNGKGEIQLSSSRLSVDFGELFRLPIKLAAFNANIRFSQIADQLLLESDEFIMSNNDIKLKGHAWLEIPQQGVPFMGLRAHYQDGKGSSTSRYLPVTVIPEKTLAWLDSSIKDAHVIDGELLFHGRLQNLSVLQQHQAGEFHALFNAENPEIDIYGGWPSVSGGKGIVSFHNTAMDIKFSQTKFAATEVDQVEVSIPDLMNAELFIHAKSDASADDLLDTLSALPVLNFFDEIKTQKHSVSGLIASDVDIFIPLEADSKKRVSVQANTRLQNVKLSIPNWMVELDKINGKLKVDNENLTASKIKGRYRHDPVVLNIDSDRINHAINITMLGDMDTSGLMTALPDYLRKPVKGKSNWSVDVSIPNDHDGYEKKGVSVKASSYLKGTQLNFPQPISLDTAAIQAVKTDITIKNRDLEYALKMGDIFSSSGRLQLDKQGSYQLQSMAVMFGEGNKPEIPQQGLELMGNIDKVNINGWTDYYKTYFGSDQVSSISLLEQISSVDLRIQDCELANQKVKDTQIQMSNDNSALVGDVTSSLIKGRIVIPFKYTASKPISAELDYIRWQKMDADKKNDADKKVNPDITDMPNLNISSKLAFLGSMTFRDFKLKTSNQSNMFVIDQLDFAKDQVQLKSSGHWQFNAESKQHVSVFNIDLRGENFGATINNLGLGETIQGGRVKFNGQIGWGDSLFKMNWETLIGEVELSLEDGYLRNVEPGAGRFVGLLSLNALPKRLFLDFGDVINKGMQFNDIKGRFNIHGEIMDTENASMDSDSAKVNIYGSTNLREKTYDQIMVIVPKIGETLPVIGSLAISNTVGWGLLLIQKIFKKPIEKSVEIEYKVSGTWENPDIELIEKPDYTPKSDNPIQPESNRLQ